MGTLLFLDDVRNPIDCTAYMTRRGVDVRIYHEQWKIVRSYDEFVEYITKYSLPIIISFDHDLSDEHYSPKMYSGVDDYNELYSEFKERTGYDCAKWLCEYCLEHKCDLPEYFVHSMNPVGRDNIEKLLKNFNGRTE